ncbi:hypothetical protein MKY15_19735 [Sporosarcina sp. FSL K6-1540]|uniref:hypothetical protein n=1 Tax=Sporosarcina sp. FSL K6-1540 TaxID=2921555 RepID=UPI003159B516
MSEFKVTFNRNVKLSTDRYRKGESATVPEDVCNALMESGVIDSDFEQIAVKRPKAKSKEE